MTSDCYRRWFAGTNKTGDQMIKQRILFSERKKIATLVDAWYRVNPTVERCTMSTVTALHILGLLNPLPREEAPIIEPAPETP